MRAILRRIAPAALLVLLTWGGALAGDLDHYYYSFRAGSGILEDLRFGNFRLETDPGPVIAASFGRRLGNFRLEGDLSFRRNAVNQARFGGAVFDGTGDIKATSLLLNFFYDFLNTTSLTPFVGGGAGLSWLVFDRAGALGVVSLDDDNLEQTLQLGGGLRWAGSDSFQVDLSYGLHLIPQIATADTVGGGGGEDDYISHLFTLGVESRF